MNPNNRPLFYVVLFSSILPLTITQTRNSSTFDSEDSSTFDSEGSPTFDSEDLSTFDSEDSPTWHDFNIFVPMETGSNYLTNPKPLSWHDASAHCIQLGAGLARVNHFELISLSSVWIAKQPIWIGLSWIEGRLQWMGHVPMEEMNMTAIQFYAQKRVDITKSCYSMDANEVIKETSCNQQLPYVCVRPSRLAEEFEEKIEDSLLNERPLGENVVPEVIPVGPHSQHDSFVTVELTESFQLDCSLPPNTSCSPYRHRWLRNGAYKSEFDGNVSISDSNFGFSVPSVTARTMWWILNWTGKVACEIVCNSTGKAYRSEEIILVLRQSVSLRVEFQFKTVNFSAMQDYFEIFMQPELRNQTGIPSEQLPVFQLDFPPFLSHPEKSINTFSFYVHWTSMDPGATEKLSFFLRNLTVFDPSSHWMNLENGASKEYDQYFQNIQVIMLNYCLDRETDPSLVFANQPTSTTRSNFRFRGERIHHCEYASRQCTADWFNPAWFRNWPRPIICVDCMASFHDYKGRCVKVIKPLPFSKSIAQCMAGYWNDQIKRLWEISDWIRSALDWIDENKNLGVTTTLDLNQLWLPIQRRTNLGPLRPVWPWQTHLLNITATEGLLQSSWGEELKSIVGRSGLLADWSRLNASLGCLKLDTKTRLLESASCTENFPMICTRPRLKLIESAVDANAQCPIDWATSTFIVERNYCYRILQAENVTFDEAEDKCTELGGHLAVATELSTLAVILNLVYPMRSYYPRNSNTATWIGLKKYPDGFKWIDQSNWTYLHQIQWDMGTYPDKPDNEETTYGVSLSVNDPNFDEVSYNHRKPLEVTWNTRVKEAGLQSFICQRVVFPQRRLSLQMQLDFVYRPIVSIRWLPLHIRGVDDRYKIRDGFLVEQSEPPKETVPNHTSLFLLTCFIENSTFIKDYATTNHSTLDYHVIKYADNNVNLIEWRATETSCETWNEGFCENLRASWVMSSATEGFFSFIVTLRHRTEKYLSENHDATFLASNTHRAAYKQWGLIGSFIGGFLEKYPEYMGQWVPATDPVAFEAEASPSHALLIKHRIVMKFVFPVRKRRETFRFKSPGNMPVTTEEAFLEEIRLYFSAKFNESRNDDGPFNEKVDFVNVRSTEFCPSEFTSIDGKFTRSHGLRWRPLESPHPGLESFSPTNTAESPNSPVILSWPMAAVGSRVMPTPYCVKQEGSMLYRRCLGNQFTGAYWESLQNDQSDCVKTSPLFDQLSSSSTWMLEELGTTRTLETIRQSVSNWNPIPAELELLANALSLVSTHKPEEELNNEDVDNFNIILHKINSLEAETLIRSQQSPSFSSHLSRATEQFFARVNMVTNEGGQRNSSQRFHLELPFVAVTSWERTDDPNHDSVMGFTVATNESSIIQSGVLFHSATFEHIEQSNVTVLLPFQKNVNNREQVTFVAYPDSRLVDASAASGKFSSAVFTSESSNSKRWTQSDHLFTGNGGMVQVHLSPAPHQLTKPLTLFFRPKIPTTIKNRHLLRCVFWDEKVNSGSGGWSIDGCWLEGSKDGLEICHCNHLSTFTLLVSRSEKELQSTVHGTILNFITLVGSLASILGLLLILATFAIFPSWRKPLGHKLLVQLSIALIILLVTFIAGVDRVTNSGICRVIAVTLHYFLLAAFCWMTIEAYNQYQRLVKVFGTYMPRFLPKATVLAWTVPLLPVIAVLIYDVDSYTGSEGYCWISPTVFYLAVLGPVVILFLINLTLFVLVIRSIAASGRGLRTNQSESKQAKEKFMASLVNFILLGMSWIFGFFAIGPTNSIVFSYVFCCSTTLQGFFLFVLYVGRDPSARQLWLQRFGVGKPESKGPSNKSKATSSAGVKSNQAESYSTTSAAMTGSSASGSSIARELKKKDFGKRFRQPQREATTSV